MKQEADIKNTSKLYADKKKKIAEANDRLLQIPTKLTNSEKKEYAEIVSSIKNSITYKMEETDLELIWQYCMLKMLRDSAWQKWNENSEKYVRIVTGIASDGKTPKITVKENEHYKIFMDSNKQLERILRDLRLTPDIRVKSRW